MQPISPSEALERKIQQLPVEVIDAFNTLIAEKLQRTSDVSVVAVVKQNEVLALIREKTSMSNAQILNKQWLDVETYFERAGWKVRYDKPGYDESYEAFFEFRGRL